MIAPVQWHGLEQLTKPCITTDLIRVKPLTWSSEDDINHYAHSGIGHFSVMRVLDEFYAHYMQDCIFTASTLQEAKDECERFNRVALLSELDHPSPSQSDQASAGLEG